MARNKILSSETHQSIFVLRNEGYSMLEFAKKLKILYNAVYYSLHSTAQTGSNQCLCSFAHLNIYFLLASLRYVFFFATLPRRPASRSCLFTVDIETGVLRVLFNEASS